MTGTPGAWSNEHPCTWAWFWGAGLWFWRQAVLVGPFFSPAAHTRSNHGERRTQWGGWGCVPCDHCVVVTARGACDWPLALAGVRTSDGRSALAAGGWAAAGGDGDRYLFNSLDIPYPISPRNTQIQHPTHLQALLRGCCCTTSATAALHSSTHPSASR
jgi:hypothetical protein